MEESLSLDGVYTSDRGMHLFALLAPDLETVASNLRYAVQNHTSFEVSVSNGRIRFTPGSSRSFDAVLSSAGSIQITADPDYLSSLADTLTHMANETDPELIGLIHTHLDVYLSHPQTGISDIVIERIDKKA